MEVEWKAGLERCPSGPLPCGNAALQAVPAVDSIYGVAVPVHGRWIEFAELEGAGLLVGPYPPGIVSAPPLQLELLEGIAALAKVCQQLRNQPHRIEFLSTPPIGEEARRRVQESHPDLLFMKMTLCELQFCAWYGKRIFDPEQLPPLHCLHGLSNSVLHEEVRELLDKLTNRRMLELAVYQKVLDIVSSGWN